MRSNVDGSRPVGGRREPVGSLLSGPMVRLLAVAVAAGLLLGSCSADDETDPAAPDVTSTGAGTAARTDTETDADTDSGETDGGTSARGVTADWVNVGITYPDLEAVGELANIDHGDYQAAYQAIIDELTAVGGVGGRRIDPSFAELDPLDEAAPELACTRFGQDEETFMVVGLFLADSVLCPLEIHDLAVIGGSMTDDRLARAQAPWFTPAASAERLVTKILDAFIESDVLIASDAPGTQRLGVVGAIEDQQIIEDVVVPLLDGAGIDIVETGIVGVSFTDVEGTEVDMGVIVERFRSQEIDTVLVYGAAAASFATALEEVAYRPQVVATNLGNLRAFIRDRNGRDLTVLEGSVAGNQPEQILWWEHPAIQDCIDVVESATGVTIYDPSTRAPDQPENIVSVANACWNLDLLERVLAAAGPDLTYDSLRSGAASLGEFDLAGYGAASLSGDKSDAGDDVYLYFWDDAAMDLVSDGEPV